MNCPKCNFNINQGEKFCRNCGLNFDQYQQMQYNQSNINAQSQVITSVQSINNGGLTNNNYQVNNDEYIKEEMLIDAYIGRNADKLRNFGFSWCMFFLGVLYAFYRKMWLFGIIMILLYVVASMITGNIPLINRILDFVIGIVASMIFKEKYIAHVTKKVANIQSKYPNKTHEELIKICKKKGGISILALIIILGWVGLVMFLLISSLFMF